MKVWNITCECGWDHDYPKISDAKVDALQHIDHHKDGKVYIDEVETEGDEEGNYQTGRSYIITSKKRK